MAAGLLAVADFKLDLLIVCNSLSALWAAFLAPFFASLTALAAAAFAAFAASSLSFFSLRSALMDVTEAAICSALSRSPSSSHLSSSFGEAWEEDWEGRAPRTLLKRGRVPGSPSGRCAVPVTLVPASAEEWGTTEQTPARYALGGAIERRGRAGRMRSAIARPDTPYAAVARRAL